MKVSYSIDKITEKNLPKKPIFRENTSCSDRDECMLFMSKKQKEHLFCLYNQNKCLRTHISHCSNVRVRFTQICNEIFVVL